MNLHCSHTVVLLLNRRKFVCYKSRELYHRCQLDCCEEDVDWKVEAVPGKGLGVIALRDIPPLTRIMVDRGYTRFKSIILTSLLILVDKRKRKTTFYAITPIVKTYSL